MDQEVAPLMALTAMDNHVSMKCEVRNLFTLGKDFEEVTGFDSMGVDWSPCRQ